jgi:hypothetical protein
MIGNVKGSVRIGQRDFTSRDDYERYCFENGLSADAVSLWADDGLVADVQQHWHRKGQTGCLFAQVAARNKDQVGWHSEVFNASASDLRQAEHIEAIDRIIRDAVASPDCALLSLLFPKVTTPEELASLLRGLLGVPSVVLECTQEFGDLTTLALRVSVSPSGVMSWLLGLGPFEFLPATRRAPSTEIVLRTKPKEGEIYGRLTDDRMAAHLADIPLALPKKSYDGLWDATYTRTREILGNTKPRPFAAAKVTYTVPTSLWQARTGENA